MTSFNETGSEKGQVFVRDAAVGSLRFVRDGLYMQCSLEFIGCLTLQNHHLVDCFQLQLRHSVYFTINFKNKPVCSCKVQNF